MDIQNILASMSIEQKAALCSGLDFWHAEAVPQAELQSVMMTDGPHGLRKQDSSSDHLGIAGSVPATCFPAAAGVCSSWDTSLIAEIAAAIAQEAQAENVGIVLGPAVNIKRSPLCGRNFEYFSEDPYLAGEMAVAYTNEMQKGGVGVSIKHFAANNQETRRMSVDTIVSERALREIYFPAFEQTVKRAQPWTVMCSYNRINGKYTNEDRWLLTDVLRKQWGFDGFVVSDWGAVTNRVSALKAELELQMPSDFGMSEKHILAALKTGELSEETLDLACARMLRVLLKARDEHIDGASFDKSAHHALARKTALETMVLLKNENVLPLDKSESIAVIGALAEKPCYQGGGSSHINPTQLDIPLDCLKEASTGIVHYAPGYDPNGKPAPELIPAALDAAKSADKIVFLTGVYITEGADRSDMRLPADQQALLEQLVTLGKPIIVVIMCGAPVEMPWVDGVSAILQAYTAGQGVGYAIAKLLYGDANPCAKLAETFPVKLEDTPCFFNFPGQGDRVVYAEDIFVGYRYYDKKKLAPLFPFGYGLSYTTFKYSNITVSADSIDDTDTLTVTCDVTNTGSRAGKEIIQLYVAPEGGYIVRPDKELKGFAKLELQPGQTATATFTLDKRSFAYWDDAQHAFTVETGKYTVLIGASSRDIRLDARVHVNSTSHYMPKFTRNTCIGDVMRYPAARQVMQPLVDNFVKGMSGNAESSDNDMASMMEVMLKFMPLRSISAFSGGSFSEEQLDGLVAALNAAAAK